MKPYLSIVIPAYNEEKRLGKTLAKVTEFASAQSYSTEIIVVDDGSSDGTLSVAAEYGDSVRALPLGRNCGKGAAVRAGMLAAVGEVRLFSDADLSTPIFEARKMLECIAAGSDICIGSRALQSEMIKVRQPFYREFMGKTFNKIVQMLVIKGIKDTQCGFKMMTARAAEEVFSRAKIDGFGFDVEALFLAQKLGFKVKELPVEWYNDDASKVNPIVDSAKMFGEILRVRSLHRDMK
ncbi:MAG: dolichyl-phosphate beta-glucosyltransferase [Chloroflexota bacterium]